MASFETITIIKKEIRLTKRTKRKMTSNKWSHFTARSYIFPRSPALTESDPVIGKSSSTCPLEKQDSMRDSKGDGGLLAPFLSSLPKIQLRIALTLNTKIACALRLNMSTRRKSHQSNLAIPRLDQSACEKKKKAYNYLPDSCFSPQSFK